jgi:hypothetical protein
MGIVVLATLKMSPSVNGQNGNEGMEALQYLLIGTPYITGEIIRGDEARSSFGYFIILHYARG